MPEISVLPDQARAEACGPRYDRLLMIETRDRTFAAIRKIAARIEPGMTEEEGMAVGRQVLREDGLLRGWHGIMLRFGVNTTLTFREKSEPGIVLGADDVFFVDIGPVWRNCEGDGGATFTTGSDPDMRRIAGDSKAIFDAVAGRWRADGLTGQALYEVAVAEAETRGWLLNLELSGHRVSDFPHKAHYDGALIDQRFAPSPDLWILEIQLRHPTRPFGAFYEDLLTDTWPISVARTWTGGFPRSLLRRPKVARAEPARPVRACGRAGWRANALGRRSVSEPSGPASSARRG